MSTYRTHRHARGEQTRTDNGTDLAFRIAAFGAIRRAVMLAREYDADAAYDGFYDDFRRLRFQDAASVRSAIRAAIGSDKP